MDHNHKPSHYLAFCVHSPGSISHLRLTVVRLRSSKIVLFLTDMYVPRRQDDSLDYRQLYCFCGLVLPISEYKLARTPWIFFWRALWRWPFRWLWLLYSFPWYSFIEDHNWFYLGKSCLYITRRLFAALMAIFCSMHQSYISSTVSRSFSIGMRTLR